MSAGVEDRTARVFEAMDAEGIDALVLGRQDNTTWATGMHRLWTAGTRPFGAGCVLVVETRGVHLLSSWDDGIPESVPFDHLYGVTWNPAVMAEAMAGIPGLSTAARIGVDGLSPGFRRAAGGFAPTAELVPVDDLLADLRRRKKDDEVDAIRRAGVVARAGVDAVVEALASGSSPIAPPSPRRRADGGVDREQVVGTDPATELRALAVEAVSLPGGAVPTSGVVVEVGREAITVDVGVLVDDWEGGLGRTLSLEGEVRGGRTEERVWALIAACTAGAGGGSIQASGGDERWLVRGVGMGFERPVVGPTVGSDVELATGDVLSVEASGEGRHHRGIIQVTEGAPEVLT